MQRGDPDRRHNPCSPETGKGVPSVPLAEASRPEKRDGCPRRVPHAVQGNRQSACRAAVLNAEYHKDKAAGAHWNSRRGSRKLQNGSETRSCLLRVVAATGFCLVRPWRSLGMQTQCADIKKGWYESYQPFHSDTF